MAFGTATVTTNTGKAIAAKRLTGGSSPSQAEPHYMAIGVGATGAARTASAADTALSSEVSRTGANNGTTVTTTQTNDTYQVVQSFTASAPWAVDEAALFDASSAGNTFMSATFPVVNLQSGDSIQLTTQVQLA